MYFMWQDLSKASIADKIAAGVRAFAEKFGRIPAQILVNERDYTTNIPGVRLGTEHGAVVQPGTFWLGPVGE